jgi:hypothetical protein
VGNHERRNQLSDEDQILSRTEVLELLSQKAREGSTSAMVALERALRARDRDEEESGDELDRILGET